MTGTDAQRRVDAFERRHGGALVALACHAALPVVLDPDLVHVLRVNYFLDPPVSLPYSAEAQLLLSPLCTEVDESLYVIDPDVRDVLLNRLVRDAGAARLRDVARLLWEYGQRGTPWADRVGLTEAQQLTALNFIDPKRALDWLTRAEAGAESGANVMADRRWYVAMRRDLEARATTVKRAQDDVESAAYLPPSLIELRDVLASVYPDVPAAAISLSGLAPELVTATSPTGTWHQLLAAAVDAMALPELFAQFGTDPAVLQAIREYWIRMSPALRVHEEGAFETPPEEWRILEQHRGEIMHVLRAVCRVIPSWAGPSTWMFGYLGGENTIITTESMAQDLRRKGTSTAVRLAFAASHPTAIPLGTTDRAADERQDGLVRARVLDIVSFGDSSLAAVVLSVHPDDAEAMPSPLVAATDMPSDRFGRKVYVVGYPSRNDSRIDPALAARIFGDEPEVLRVQPGEIVGIDPVSTVGKTRANGPEPILLLHNCFTSGGNAGSPLVDLATGKVLGVHIGASNDPGTRGLKIGRAVPLWTFVQNSHLQDAGVFGAATTDRADDLRERGRQAHERGEFAEAERLYMESLKQSERINDAAGTARSSVMVGDLARGMGRLGDASERYRRALDIQLELGDRAGVMGTLLRLGQLAYLLGNLDEAEDWYRRALAADEGNDNRAVIADVHQRFGDLAEARGDLAWAEESYRSALTIYAEQDHPHGVALSRLRLGELALRRGDYDDAEESFQHALMLFEQLDDRSGLARVYNQLGNLELYRGRLEAAEDRYQHALRIYDAIADRHAGAAVRRGLGRIAQDRGDGAGANAHYREALSIYTEFGDERSAGNTSIELGDLETERGDFSLARGWYERSLETLRRINDENGLAAAHMRLGELTIMMGNLADAERSFRESLAMYERLGDKSGAAHARRRLQDLIEARGIPGAPQPPADGGPGGGPGPVSGLPGAAPVVKPTSAHDIEVAAAEERAATLKADQEARMRAAPWGLTPRELEVLRLLVDGKTNRQIAQDLWIATNTVGVHVGNILRKLGVESRGSAVAMAVRAQLYTE